MNTPFKERYIVYPASPRAGLLDIYHHIGDYIKNKFPINFFESIVYNTKDSFYSTYFKQKKSKLRGNIGIFEQKRYPRFCFIIDDKNNENNEAGFGQPIMPTAYPIMFGLHPDMHDVLPFFKDDMGVGIYTTNKRIRINFEVIIENQTADDQDFVQNWLENTLKVYYGERLHGIKGNFILPNDMMKFLRTTLFFNNIKIAQTEKSKELRDEFYNNIQNTYNEHLMKFSSQQIIPKYNPQNKNKMFYIYQRTYNQIYFQLTSPPEKTDGEKRNEVYDKYTVTCAGFFEVYKPVSYVLRSPDVICGNLFDDIVTISRDMDKRKNTIPIGLAPEIPNRNILPDYVRSFINHQKFKSIFTEYEVCLESPKDNFSLLEWLSDEKFNNKYDNIIKHIKTLDHNEFFRKYLLLAYEGDFLLDKNDLFFEKGMVYLNNTDSKKLYSFYLLEASNTESLRKEHLEGAL